MIRTHATIAAHGNRRAQSPAAAAGLTLWCAIYGLFLPWCGAAPYESGPWKPLFDGTSLAGWQQTPFDQQGTANVQNGQLMIQAGRPMSGVTWQGEFPTTNYEVTLEAKRVDGDDFFCALTFPVGQEFCSLIVGGWGGGLVGLSSLDGRDASENETTVFDNFEDDQWYRVRLLVTDDLIKAWIGEERYVNVARAGLEFSVRIEVEQSCPFGLATYRTTAAYRNVQMRRITVPSKHPGTSHAEFNIPYAGTGHARQRLDLIRPSRPKSKPLPVIAYIHGGAWQNGDKRQGHEILAPFVESGNYAGVSIGYRLSSDATWPAQIHDCKAAIRWIRANAAEFGLDPNRIGVMGHSAGGHLAAMLGTSGGVSELEGDLGDSLDTSSRVTCVVDFFGPSDLLTMGNYSSKIDHNAPESPESRLLGGAVQERPDAARSASPISHVSEDDAAIILVHGTHDELVPFEQSQDLNTSLERAGVPASLLTVEGGGHGRFAGTLLRRRVADFLANHLRGKDTPVKDETLAPSQSDSPLDDQPIDE